MTLWTSLARHVKWLVVVSSKAVDRRDRLVCAHIVGTGRRGKVLAILSVGTRTALSFVKLRVEEDWTPIDSLTKWTLVVLGAWLATLRAS